MKKYPVIGASRNVYEAVISENDRFLTCKLFCADCEVYTFSDIQYKYTNNYIGLVKETVRRYELVQAERAEQARKKAENLREFEEWNGDCRE